MHVPYPDAPPESRDSYTGDGVCRLLQDSQVDLCGREQAWYRRTVVKVQTRAGAERAAHFLVEFDPAAEHISVHCIRVRRAGVWHEYARPETFQIFRRETNLERLVFDGRLTASLLIPDVRIDDIVEIALTTYSNNEVMAGKYSAWSGFDAVAPWVEYSHRQRRPLARRIVTKSFNGAPQPVIFETGAVEQAAWRVVGQHQIEPEEYTPPWTILGPALQFSEFESWNEVAQLFVRHYEADQIPASLVAELDRLAAEHAGPEQRAAEWLRFVQSNLRYFALSFGVGGWIPRPLEVIWSSRLGDCKDAAQLYTAGARYLGLDACAAFVSTRYGQVLNDFLPGATTFDHCIARLRIDGVSYWLDPTAPTQSGSIKQIHQPHFGWALPLREDVTGLERLGDGAASGILEYEDIVEFGAKKANAARLTRNITYRSWAADWIRNRFANEGMSNYSSEVLQGLQMTWPAIRETAPIEACDDKVDNRVVATFRCEIPDPWKQLPDKKLLGFAIVDSDLAAQFDQLKGTARITDIHLGTPRTLTRSVRLMMPRKWTGEGWHLGDETPGLSFSNRLAFEGRTISNDRELVIEKRSIPASDSGAYNRTVAALHQNMVTIHAIERFGSIRPPGNWLRPLQIAGVALAVVLAIMVARIAINWVSAMVSSPPQSVGHYYQRGIQFNSDGQYPRAIQELSEAIRLDPNFANAIDRRGVAYKNLGHYDRAIFDYDRAIALNPHNWVYYYNRANAYYYKDQFDRAIGDYTKAVRLNPDVRPLINRGRAYFAQARFREAIGDYDEALKREPDHELAYFNRANARLRLHDYEAAAADYDSALKAKVSAVSLFGRGVAKLRMGDVAAGNADIAAAKALDDYVAAAMAVLKIIP